MRTLEFREVKWSLRPAQIKKKIKAGLGARPSDSFLTVVSQMTNVFHYLLLD